MARRCRRGSARASLALRALARPARAGSWLSDEGLFALTLWTEIVETGPAEFSARQTRASRSHGLTRPVQRRLLRRRLGVLVLAMAVPAVAAPDLRQAVQAPATGTAQATTAAFDPEFAAWQPAANAPQVGLSSGQTDAAMLDAANSQAELALLDPAAARAAPKATINFAAMPMNSGPAARTFTMGGNFTDMLRAEECLTMAIYYEAASESTDGQRAVAQVVMNRVRHPSYPNTVCGVVFQGSQRRTGCQFSFTCDGALARRPQAAAWNKARRVASAALGGFVFAPVGLATHYHTTAIYPYWAPSLTPVGVIGAHRFYRFGNGAGQPGAFTAAYRGGEPLPVRNTGPAVVPLIGDATALLPQPAAAISPALPGDMGTPAAYPAPVASATPAEPSLFPQSGQVREEFANSGRWLTQP